MTQESLRAASMFYDKDGYPIGKSALSHTDCKTRALCVVPPEVVMPVIFVPGIMGSNLKLKEPIPKFNDEKDIAWRPDDAFFTAFTFGNLKPARRRQVLNPENTALDDRAKIPDSKLPIFKAVDKETRENWKKEFARRGWGTVMLSSYGEVLYHLELNLNSIYNEKNELADYWQESILGDQQKWGEKKGFQVINANDLKKEVGDKYWFPVHAAGYNWLQSNEDAGKHLASQIDKFIAHYKKLGFPCEKVILVTHSMGGLAARAACHPAMGNITDKVAGVVHGEQPAIGAPAAYKRMHAGFEADGMFNIVAAITARALGWSGKEVTATLSNAPGGLQLLPTKSYPAGWLRVQQGDKVALQLPVSDPYEEIYREKDKWWRLMNPEWINPQEKNPTSIVLKKIWNDYLERIDLAEQFHDKLSDYYHPVTHAHYGADDKFKAWTTFTWKLEKSLDMDRGGDLEMTHAFVHGSWAKMGGEALVAGPVDNNALGHTTIHANGIASTFVASPADQPGDGTVPAVSGAASASKAQFSARMNGYDHQGSYQNANVKNVTTYSVARIAHEAKLA